MIGFASLMAGVVLLLLLVAWAARDSREARIAQDDNAGAEMCPPEFVAASTISMCADAPRSPFTSQRHGFMTSVPLA